MNTSTWTSIKSLTLSVRSFTVSDVLKSVTGDIDRHLLCQACAAATIASCSFQAQFHFMPPVDSSETLSKKLEWKSVEPIPPPRPNSSPIVLTHYRNYCIFIRLHKLIQIIEKCGAACNLQSRTKVIKKKERGAVKVQSFPPSCSGVEDNGDAEIPHTYLYLSKWA